MSLYSLFLDNRGRNINKNAHYFHVYEKHFSKHVNAASTFLEIGTGHGGSAQMWKRYFGPLARIVSIDISAKCKRYEDEQVAIRIGDQTDTQFLQSVLDEFGAFDMVLDDGSHMMKDVRATFDFLYGKIAPNGVYMIEDLHTAYWPEFGGGFRAPDSFIEFSKDRVDDLNAPHSRGSVPPSDFMRQTTSIHFYDSIIVYERGGYVSRKSLTRGGPQPEPGIADP
jgi:cephalosporin hydroxylase